MNLFKRVLIVGGFFATGFAHSDVTIQADKTILTKDGSIATYIGDVSLFSQSSDISEVRANEIISEGNKTTFKGGAKIILKNSVASSETIEIQETPLGYMATADILVVTSK